MSSPSTPSGDKSPTTDLVSQRLRSLDAYRGLIMIMLAFVGFGLAKTAALHLEQNPDSAVWSAIEYQFEHVEWVGCAIWDMIQPSFMFMVGVSMAFSYAKRKRLGHSYVRMLGHAVWRSVVLILLGVFLISNWSSTTNWSLVNVLTQIGLGYAIIFLLWDRGVIVQALAAIAILAGTWFWFVSYPNAGIDIEQGAPEVGVTAAWAQEHLAGIPAPWHKNANVGHAVDLRLLNQLPREEPFKFNRGGYQTINFIPSLATMLFGLMCGELLRSQWSARWKLLTLLCAGLCGLAIGQLLNVTDVCPIVKRIWTPSWAVFSTGWCCLILAALYGVIDVLGYRRWAFPLVVVGMNSIAMYCMGMLLKPWTAQQLQTHLGEGVFQICGPMYEPMVQSTMIGLVFWLVCLWMYRQKIFVRI
jgi:heparan-alpha-glucosaminide N-acetyltransferase